MKLSKQNIFDKVWDWFIVQGHALSKVEEQDVKAPMCRYRKDLTADCQTRCAIGIFIPDNLYSPDVEVGVKRLFESCPNHNASTPEQLAIGEYLSGVFEVVDYTFLRQLQSAHDGSFDLYGLKQNLIEFANDHNLTVPENN